jgi:hypothetical protein
MIVRIPKIVPAASDWASTFGVDRRGVFSGVRLGDTEQLLRWIEPGPFVMGSEKGELGKYEDEGPIHRVTIPNGFWLGETPVTQQFYQAVTGENPSRFHGKPQHPVEQVSWEDATAFCEKLTMLLAEFDGTSARLPSEAEWEYASTSVSGSCLPLRSTRASVRSLEHREEAKMGQAPSRPLHYGVARRGRESFSIVSSARPLGNAADVGRDTRQILPPHPFRGGRRSALDSRSTARPASA